MTVLIVEDNQGVRRLLQSVISEVATLIWDCSDGVDALAAYLTHRPDVVLMDVQMPMMDGLAATRLIIGSDPSANVVIVTDHDDDDLRRAAREAGAYGYVLKRDLLALPTLIRSAVE